MLLYLDSLRGTKALKGIQIVSNCTFLQHIYLFFFFLLNLHNVCFFVIYSLIFFAVLLQKDKMSSWDMNHLTGATSDEMISSLGSCSSTWL